MACVRDAHCRDVGTGTGPSWPGLRPVQPRKYRFQSQDTVSWDSRGVLGTGPCPRTLPVSRDSASQDNGGCPGDKGRCPGDTGVSHVALSQDSERRRGTSCYPGDTSVSHAKLSPDHPARASCAHAVNNSKCIVVHVRGSFFHGVLRFAAAFSFVSGEV